MKIKLDIQKFASGTINFPNNGSMYGKIEWSSTVAGSTAAEKAQLNKSSVTAILYVKRNDGYTTWGNFSGAITINGSTSSVFYPYLQVGNSWYEVGRYTIDVSHNQDGSKTIGINGWITGPTETSWQGKSVSGSGTVALDTIQRMSSITAFTPLGDIQGRNNIEGDFKVDYTRYNSSFTDDLVLEYMDRSVDPATWTTFKTITNYESGTTFNFTSAELQTLYDGSPATPLVNVRAHLETYSGQTLIGESTQYVLTSRIYDADPVFSDFDFEDTNSTTVALTGDDSINVNGYSNIKITISASDKATAQKGATMVKYKVNIGDKTTDITYSGSASVNGTITGSPNGTYQVYAIDSRGLSTLITKFATSQIEYFNLTRDTNYSATRDDGGIGSNVSISFSGSIWNGNFGDVNNGFTTAKYLLKKTDSSTWIDLGASMTNITPTITNNTYSFTGQIRSDNPDTSWDLDSSYDIKIILEDELSSVEFIMTVASATPNISLGRKGVGIMCDYDEALGGLLQIGGTKYSPVSVNNSYSTSQTETYSCEYLNPTILYDGGVTGTNGAVTLTDDWDKYTYIEVFFTRAEYAVGSVKVPTNLAGDYYLPVRIQSAYYGYGNGFWIGWKELHFMKNNKKRIENGNYGQLGLPSGNNPSSSAENTMKVLRVIGWK